MGLALVQLVAVAWSVPFIILSNSVTTMSMPISRKAFIPVWLVVFALFALSGAPMTLATGVLLLIGLGIAPAIVLILWNRTLSDNRRGAA